MYCILLYHCILSPTYLHGPNMEDRFLPPWSCRKYCIRALSVSEWWMYTMKRSHYYSYDYYFPEFCYHRCKDKTKVNNFIVVKFTLGIKNCCATEQYRLSGGVLCNGDPWPKNRGMVLTSHLVGLLWRSLDIILFCNWQLKKDQPIESHNSQTRWGHSTTIGTLQMSEWSLCNELRVNHGQQQLIMTSDSEIRFVFFVCVCYIFVQAKSQPWC